MKGPPPGVPGRARRNGEAVPVVIGPSMAKAWLRIGTNRGCICARSIRGREGSSQAFLDPAKHFLEMGVFPGSALIARKCLGRISSGALVILEASRSIGRITG